jgi:hypothetical protein
MGSTAAGATKRPILSLKYKPLPSPFIIALFKLRFKIQKCYLKADGLSAFILYDTHYKYPALIHFDLLRSV